MTDLDPILNRICRHCGLTFGAHEGSGDRCPRTEGGMDWPDWPTPTFADTGVLAFVPRGTKGNVR